jgi:hypothetical protein
MNFDLGLKLYIMVTTFLVMALSVMFLIVSILFVFTLQKFYVRGQPLLNNHKGRILYGAVCAIMICMSASAVTNNRTLIANTFLLFSIIAAILALFYIKQLSNEAQLSTINDTNGNFALKLDDVRLGQMQLTKTFQGLCIAYVSIATLTFVGGMLFTFSFNDEMSEVSVKASTPSTPMRKSYF